MRSLGKPGCKDVRGFTLVETLVASLVLIVALLGLFEFLAVSVATSYSTRAREGAVTLARQISEDARSIPFEQLSPGTVSGSLQAMPGLASTASPPSWQLARRSVTYTITATECSVDDPKDGFGPHDGTFCLDSASQGTTDASPVDFKRVSVDVRWITAGRSHDVGETALISSAGQAIGLTTSGLQLASPTNSSPTSPTINTSSANQLQFSVTAPTGTTGIVWTVNGVAQSWTTTQSATGWTSSPWTITSLSDGTYQVGAQAENGSGVIGPAVTIPVRLIRSIPAAPKLIAAGFNPNLNSGGSATTAAELQWQPNSELNVTGYRVLDPTGAVVCTTANSLRAASCGTHAWCATATSCIDLAPPSPGTANLNYGVAALYYDADGVLQQGPVTTVSLATTQTSTFSLAPSRANTASSCPGTTGGVSQDMTRSYTPGADTTQQGKPATFCSDAYASGTALSPGGTATAYLANPGNSACPVTATLSLNGDSAHALSSSLTVPAKSPVTAYTFSFSGGQILTTRTGDRQNLTFNLAGSGCPSAGAILHYGAAQYLSQFRTAAGSVTAPPVPASLSMAPAADGTATISWPAPADGSSVSFYRIYRDGRSYTDRYDTVDGSCSPTCTYTDSARSGPHTYYVTAVGSSGQGEAMAESTPAGPANG